MKTKSLLFLLSILVLSNLVLAQKPFPQKVDLDWEGFSCKIPDNWRYDPYGSSSVCDCPGVIFDNFDDDLRINVYFTDLEGLSDPMRDEVWSYKWQASDAAPFEYKNVAGIKFTGWYGNWQSDGEEATVKQKVIRIDGGLKKDQMLRIYVFGPEKEVKGFEHQLNAWLDTIEQKKMKRR